MAVSDSKGDAPEGFNSPTALPRTQAQALEWQHANRAWWEDHPMRYDFSGSVGPREFSREFYEEIDRRFFADAQYYLPPRRIPFDGLIDYEALSGQDVLEIGVGNGSHAQLLASRAHSYAGIDLTSYAVGSTSGRLACFGVQSPRVRILQMDAERLAFGDESFDFIWSWGVIHHSSNTERVVEEMRRVLRPGGRAITMVYFRNVWNYYIYSGLFGGVLKRHLFRTRSLHLTRQRESDGALARFYTIPEWTSLVSPWFDVQDVRILGSKTELVALPGGRLKSAVLRAIPDSVGRLFTHRCRMGAFLVSTLTRR